jgi:hypothetical protein
MIISDKIKNRNHPTELTLKQKLEALSYRFYSGQEWKEVKAGQYYTTSRSDLEIYLVVGVDEDTVYTSYLPLGGPIAKWPVNDFTQKGFGPKRVLVPNYVLGLSQSLYSEDAI